MPKNIVRILNCDPSVDTNKDWQLTNALEAKVISAAPALPTSKDLREKWWKISDQASTGACVGWAVGDSVLRWHLVKAKVLDDRELLSARFIWMAAKETDELTSYPSTFIEADGTTIKAALDICRKFGAVTAKTLPFDSGKLYPGDDKTFYALAAKFKLASYFNLGVDTDAWKTWIANNGPVAARVIVDKTWDAATANDGKLDAFDSTANRGGHAVGIVGYTADRFIVRNSWGTGWGDNGFAYASFDYVKNAFTEAYGISV